MQGTISELDRLPNLEAYMDRASALELARRSLLGAPVYTVISLIMLAGTPMLMDYGRWAVVEGALLILLGCVRVWFALNFVHRYDHVGERAVIEFSILTAIQSLTLGVLSAIVIWQYWAAQQVVMTIVLSAGCIAAGTSALSVRRSAQLIFLACVLAPFGISVYFVGGLAQAVLIVGFLSLMAFLVQDGGQAKGAYFDRLKKHYSEEILRRRTALETQAKQEFLRDIGHDIRAPINAIVGMTDLLLDEALGSKTREIAATIRASTDSLLNKIGNIPGSIKSSHPIAQSHVGAMDISQCVSKIMNLYSMEADAKGLEIITNLEGIPANVLSCDEGQFEQVLANLVSNAVKYTEKGSITLSTSFGNLQNGALLLEFSLADTGVGIPVHDRERLFNPFNIEGAKTSGKFGGDGLGLPLCKGLVELMGGNIWIEDNEAGQGTVIKFTIRAELEPADNSWRQTIEAEEQTEASLLEDKPSVFGKLDKIYPHRILVVDDDDIHRKIVCAQLKKMGYTADEAADGEEAIAVVMQGNYDLVFMDLRMPNMDGIEASFWIREKFNGSGHMRIIALTGDATVEAREQCMRAGMDNFITKPVQIKDLEAILSHTSHHKQNIQTQLGNTDSVH